ncbi:MAG: C25 family cysteine peptidase, partial [bacterium]|nr:C25 family cysteine peptidase [bacterium]
MRLKLMLLTTAVVALVASAALGATGAIPVKDGPNAMQLVAQRGEALSYQVSIGELSALDVATKAGDFTRLAIPGFHSSMVEGTPELPMMNRLIALPAGARARVEVVSVSSRTFNLADFGIDSPLMPVQPSVSKSADLSALPFVYDRASYDTDKVSRELVKVVDMGVLRAYGVGRLEVSPVEYLPRTNQIVVHDEIEFRVVFDGADKSSQDYRVASTNSPFFAPIYGMLDGAKTVHDDNPDIVRDVVTMVIVTPAMFEAQLANFVQWKTERGFNVIVGVIGSPQVGSTTTSIQAYLHGLYNAGTPELPAPSFVIFVGDIAECPTFTEAGDSTDRPYCSVDADLYPEMYYGRFSATNSSQLQAILDKTMMYDQFTMPDPSYLAEVTMIAGVDGSYAPTYGNGQINYGTEHYFNAAHGLTSNTWLYPASDGAGAPAAIVQTCNDGVSYINYTAHGSETSWADPAMTQANVNSMTNAGKYFMAVGNCCLTSTYDYAECFGETMIRAPNKGAIGYIGASNSTYWDEDYWWGVGYHASSEIDGTAWPVEHTGIGAYDGVFHDHGEAMTQWYVTNDALNFAGNLAVSQSGSSRITYYWNIYNLMGDPSLSTYMGVPGTNPVSHVPTLFTNAVTFALDAAPGSYVGLTQNGVLMAAGTVGVGGSAVLDLNGFLTPGSAHLVVMMQNLEPYIVDVPVIVPAVVSIVPSAIDANVTTPVTVTVYEEDGVTPIVGLDVWAEGLGYTSAAVATNASGVAVISVTYPYGPTVDVVGKRPADPYELFREPLTVNALTLTSPDLTVTTDIGMTDLFPLNLPGTLHATSGEAGATLHAVLPNGSEQSTGASSLTLTAAQTGVITGIIALSGYDLYTETFDVVEAYGQLTGHVSLGGSPAVGAVVRGLDAGMVEVFSATTDAAGDYDVGEDVLVDDYTIVVDFFGYLHFEQAMFLNYGPNTFDVAMVAAPSGVLTGLITDSVTAEPLQGTVKVYRGDNGALYTETASDASGAFTTSALPYFTYTVAVRASHHVPASVAVEIDGATVVKDFLLDPTNGDILIVDDDTVARQAPDKFDEKGGLIAAGYEPGGERSTTAMAAELEALGYGVTVQPSATTVPADWPLYDLVVWASGANTNPLASATLRSALIVHVQSGGHLLLEGGEVAYKHNATGAFASTVMHTNDWNHDGSGSLTVAAPAHHVMSVPNVIAGPIAITYAGYGDQDGAAPLADAVKVGAWATYPADAGVICYDPNPAPAGGQIAFFTFNYAALNAAGRAPLLENTVLWLLTPESGAGSVSGHIDLQGSADDSGALVEAIPNGGSTYTNAAGNYSLPGLYAGSYTIRASKLTWSIASTSVTLAEGQQLTGVNLTLTSVSELNQCLQPALPIADYATVTSVMPLSMGAGVTVTSVEVFVDITHTYQGDLTVDLRSPAGTTVRLHNQTGSGTDNIYGWYPDTLTPAGDLGLFAGQVLDGNWTLTVADMAGGDIGTLDEWCLKIVYGGGSTGAGDAPSVLTLSQNYPNPFNPSTKISFAVP